MSERMTAEELARDRATVLLRDGRKVEVQGGRGDTVRVLGPDEPEVPLPGGGAVCPEAWPVPLADIEKVQSRKCVVRIWFGPGTPALKPMAPLFEEGATLMAYVRIPEDVEELREAYVRLVARAEIAQKAGPGQLVKAVGEVGRGGDQNWEWRPHGCGKFYRGDLPAGSPVHGGDGRLIEPGERVRLSDGRRGWSRASATPGRPCTTRSRRTRPTSWWPPGRTARSTPGSTPWWPRTNWCPW